jgi:hypothetical protein
MRITRAHAAVTALASATALAACSSGAATPQGSASRTPAPVAAASASASPSTAAQLALAAYTAMWGDVQALSETSNYTDPRLGDHLDGSAYMTVSENMSVDKAHGVIALGAPILHPRVLAANATAVSVADCLDDTHWLEYYASTRKLTNNVPGGHRYVAATVTDKNGTWKVTTLDVRGEGTCT